jgi:predicted dehydrogenase
MYPTEGQHTFKQVTMDDAHPGYYLREQRHQTTIIPAHNNHVLEMDHFARVIRGAEKPRCPGEDAKKTLEALIAIIESTESRRTITLQC